MHEAEYSISVATSRAVSEDSYRDANAREPDCELPMAARGVRPQDAGRAALAGAPHQRPLAPAAAAAQHQHTARRLHARWSAAQESSYVASPALRTHNYTSRTRIS